jgi:hypothetical protein
VSDHVISGNGACAQNQQCNLWEGEGKEIFWPVRTPARMKYVCHLWGNKQKLRLHNYVVLTSQAMIISKAERKTKGNDQIRQREKTSETMTSEALHLSSGSRGQRASTLAEKTCNVPSESNSAGALHWSVLDRRQDSLLPHCLLSLHSTTPNCLIKRQSQ